MILCAFILAVISQPNEVRSLWNFQDNFILVYQADLRHQRWPHPPSLQSGTFNILQVWTSRTGVLGTLLIMLESWNLAHMSRITYHDDPWCQGRPHPPSPQSGTINVLQVWTLRMRVFWHTSNHARELKYMFLHIMIRSVHVYAYCVHVPLSIFFGTSLIPTWGPYQVSSKSKLIWLRNWGVSHFPSCVHVFTLCVCTCALHMHANKHY